MEALLRRDKILLLLFLKIFAALWTLCSLRGKCSMAMYNAQNIQYTKCSEASLFRDKIFFLHWENITDKQEFCINNFWQAGFDIPRRNSFILSLYFFTGYKTCRVHMYRYSTLKNTGTIHNISTCKYLPHNWKPLNIQISVGTYFQCCGSGIIFIYSGSELLINPDSGSGRIQHRVRSKKLPHQVKKIDLLELNSELLQDFIEQNICDQQGIKPYLDPTGSGTTTLLSKAGHNRRQFDNLFIDRFCWLLVDCS